MAGKAQSNGNAYWLLSLFPAAAFTWLIFQIPNVAHQHFPALNISWVPELNASFSFQIDGLSMLMSLLVLGIGALILVYASGYMDGHEKIGRFFVILIFFMLAMLGVVTANNIILLFVFWELTSISSYLLIGFNHESPESQTSAQQALFVTGAGGLCLMAGLILIGNAAGSWELSEILKNGEAIRSSSLFPMMTFLVILGAFTKSAQFPFHFWLPNAMAAPTPVSAYLHSATMVKAGVYILARLNPVLGQSAGWTWTLILIGGFTAILGGWMAWQQADMKKIMAYTTISALGILVFLIGIGGKLGSETAMLFLIVHSLYKGALFMIAGAIDHETNTRDVNKLGGLARLMPITLAAAFAATFSMMGIPPLLGFTGKELIYETTLDSEFAVVGLTIAAFVMNFFNVAAAAMILHRPFFEEPAEDFDSSHVHEGPWKLWLGPVVLGITGIVSWIFIESHFFSIELFSPAVSSVYGKTVEIHLHALPVEFNLVPTLSIITIIAGVAFAFFHQRIIAWAKSWTDSVGNFGTEAAYFVFIDGMMELTRDFSLRVQNGYLRRYLEYVFLTLLILVALPFALYGNWSEINLIITGAPRINELIISFVIVSAAFWVVRFPGRLSAIAALGVVGYGMALLFLYFNAPDLAMTQFSIETLTVIIFVLVLYRLPRYKSLTSTIGRYRDALVAACVGLFMFGLVLFVTSVPYSTHISEYYGQSSYKLAKGRNVVNVILVDFRGMDTMVEISVLAVAAIGVLALLHRMRDQIDAPTLMNKSLIIQTASRYLIPIILLFAVFVLIRGHNDPGGGFIGGLLAASAFVLYIFAYSLEEARELLGVTPRSLIVVGLVLAIGSALYSPIILQQPFMQGVWGTFEIPAIGKLGTPLIFDVGVMMVVLGSVLGIIFSLANEDENLHQTTQGGSS